MENEFENSNIAVFRGLVHSYGLSEIVNESFANWLRTTGYFSISASISYHSNGTGGLFDHSCAVAKSLNDLTDKNSLNWERKESPAVIGLFHDVCKLQDYVPVKDRDGVITGFKRTDPKDQIYTGHGEKSVLMLAPFMPLTAEEIACIRWHMGAFDEKDNWSHYTAAVRQFPNVLWTHQADMIAAHILQR